MTYRVALQKTILLSGFAKTQGVGKISQDKAGKVAFATFPNAVSHKLSYQLTLAEF
jgi:hypothetical protein